MSTTLNVLISKMSLRSAYGKIKTRSRLRRRRKSFWSWTKEDQRRLAFYRQFINPESIVFDIGCNLGNRAKVFVKLGSTVIGVEPQSPCANFLEKVFEKTPQFHLVRMALGATPGTAEMFVSNASTISSLSKDWIASVQKTGRFNRCTWNERETVPVETLDNLISKFGEPDFVKIDVEGFEDQVLAGLSSSVKAVSLEFTPEYIEAAFRCVDHLEGLAEYQYQLALGEDMQFHLPQWIGAEAIKNALREVPLEQFGDIYAKIKIS